MCATHFGLNLGHPLARWAETCSTQGIIIAHKGTIGTYASSHHTGLQS